MQRDYYEVLGISQQADEREIKRAYRKLAMEYHPDRNNSDDAESKFKEASEAYEVLSDPQKRQIYDRAGFDGLRGHGFSGFSGVGVEDIFSSFGDIFGDLFGFGARGGRRRSSAQRGADLRYELAIELEDAVFGTEREITFEQLLGCEDCGGSGGAPGSNLVRCSHCNGTGQVVHGQGLFLVSTTCAACSGKGSFQQTPCEECRGDGRVRAERSVTVKIPPGFDDGMSLRYGGEGEAGARGGPPGDLYVTVHVKPHERFRRRGDDLVAAVGISIVEASLGAEIEIETLEGPETVKVPKGTQPDDVVTLKKLGAPRLQGSGRGDLHVVCKVEIPTSLSSKQKKLLKDFEKTEKPRKRRFF